MDEAPPLPTSSLTSESGPLSARSSFVTTVAWVFIVLGGLLTAITAMQNILIQTFPFPRPLPSDPDAEVRSVFSTFFANWVRIYFFAVFLVTAGLLASAIGLLYRRNWGRIGILTVLWGGIVWIVLSCGLMLEMISSPNTKVPPEMRGAMLMTCLMTGLFAVGVAVVFGWLIRRLRSEAVRREFLSAGAVRTKS